MSKQLRAVDEKLDILDASIILNDSNKYQVMKEMDLAFQNEYHLPRVIRLALLSEFELLAKKGSILNEVLKELVELVAKRFIRTPRYLAIRGYAISKGVIVDGEDFRAKKIENLDSASFEDLSPTLTKITAQTSEDSMAVVCDDDENNIETKSLNCVAEVLIFVEKIRASQSHELRENVTSMKVPEAIKNEDDNKQVLMEHDLRDTMPSIKVVEELLFEERKRAFKVRSSMETISSINIADVQKAAEDVSASMAGDSAETLSSMRVAEVNKDQE